MAVIRTFLAVALSATVVLALFSDPRVETPGELFQRALGLIDADRISEAEPLLARAYAADPRNGDIRAWHSHVAFHEGLTALIAGKHAAARTRLAAALAANVAGNLNMDNRIIISRWLSLVDEHEQALRRAPDHVFRIQVLYVTKGDYTATNLRGEPTRIQGVISPEVHAPLIRDQQLTRVHVEALSRGRLSIAWEQRTVDATLKRVYINGRWDNDTAFAPDWESITPPLHPLFWAGRNRYDATLLYTYGGGGLLYWPYARWEGGVPLVPYQWRSRYLRGSIEFTLGTKPHPPRERVWRLWGDWVVLHEFFHHVEQLSGRITPEHAHLPANRAAARANFPDWVPGPEERGMSIEYSWYRYHFLNTVPKRMEQLSRETGILPAWRNMSYVNRWPDRTDDRLYRTCTAATARVPVAERSAARSLLQQAETLARSGKHGEAWRLAEAALRRNPADHQILNALGWWAIAHRTNDLALSDRYYSELARVFPDANECFGIGHVFMDRGAPGRAVRYFRVGATLTNTGTPHAAWLARALAAAGDSTAAAAAYAPVAAHPVGRAPLAVIHNRAVDVHWFSSQRPDDGGQVWMMRGWQPPPPRMRWRLLPSADGVHVRLVSDFNWRCLGITGDTVSLVPLADSAAQEWKLVALPDGQRRILSRLSGLALAIVPGASGKPHTLVLRPPDSSPHQFWSVEVSDPLTAAAEAVGKSWIASSNGTMLLSVAGGNTRDGTPVLIWERHEVGWNGEWKLVPAGAGNEVYILFTTSGKCLVALAADGGYRITIAAASGAAAQRWRLVPGSGGLVRLVNVSSGLALTPDAWDRRMVTLLPVEDTAPQLWKIEPMKGN